MNIIDKVTLNTSTSIKKAMEIIDTSEIKIALVVDISMHKELITYCQEKDTMFLSTPFDHDSVILPKINTQ